MNAFTQKLRVIYQELFNKDIDKFTTAFLDYSKFEKDKFGQENLKGAKKQFFLNRKTVLRRWLQKGTTCTSDFKKSFYNYPISHYQLRGIPLFTLEDFQKESNLEIFENRVEDFLKYKNRVQIKTDYQYIYTFCEKSKEIDIYKITEWSKGKSNQTKIILEKNNYFYNGTFSLSDENNIFMTLQINNITIYFLFHDSDDRSCPYIVGTSMGYLSDDNKVPLSQKVIFSREILDKELYDLQFILNETESIRAIENRLNLNSKEVKVTHLTKYTNRLKQYVNFFTRLSQTKYKQFFYYRLAFREFNMIQKLFQKVSTKETYFVFDYQRAILELIKTVEEIKDIPLYIVMELNEENIFLQWRHKDIEIKNRFLNLASKANIKTSIIFVIEENQKITTRAIKLLKEMQEHQISIRMIEKKKIVHEVNSLDFIFIQLNDKRDFVFADPIRDSKDVYKLFINKTTMDEYRTDYQKFLEKSKKWE